MPTARPRRRYPWRWCTDDDVSTRDLITHAPVSSLRGVREVDFVDRPVPSLRRIEGDANADEPAVPRNGQRHLLADLESFESEQ